MRTLGLLILAALVGGLIGGVVGVAVTSWDVNVTLAVLTALSTIALAVFAWTNWRIMNHMEWLTGAMERHSDQMRQMQAHALRIKMVWWDKTEGGPFPAVGKHDTEHMLEKLYIGVPPSLRKKKPNWFQRHVLGRRV